MAGPLLSVSELLSSATGINWSNIPAVRADPLATHAEAARILRRAGAFVTRYCSQTLWATADTEILPCPGRRAVLTGGMLTVFPRASPIVSVSSVELSADGVNWQPLQGTVLLNTGPGSVPQQFSYLVGPNLQQTTVATSFANTGYVRIQYINGFANAVLLTASNVGDTSLHIDDPTGFLPGDSVTVYDDLNEETAVVDLSYQPGVTSLPLVAPLAFAHAVGVGVSEMDESVRQAVILYVTEVVRNDYNAAIAANRTTATQGALSAKIAEARELLNPFRRIL